ncbi:MAG TPA: hypothetical protein VFO46_02195 [Candidatus Sulfotelmatobacter sp.]|nr:hypothetical protein [Candidatus Sulfotelmatobacter sp.]
MKHSFASKTLVILFAATVVMSAAAPAHAAGPCSMARVAGHWSLTDNGTVIGIGPRTAVGVFTLDASGNLLNGVAASSLNGVVASETFSGTYTVNADCSGSFDVKIYSGGTELFELTAFTAFDDDMRQMRAVFTSIVAPDGTSLQSVINLDAKKQ